LLPIDFLLPNSAVAHVLLREFLIRLLKDFLFFGLKAVAHFAFPIAAVAHPALGKALHWSFFLILPIAMFVKDEAIDYIVLKADQPILPLFAETHLLNHEGHSLQLLEHQPKLILVNGFRFLEKIVDLLKLLLNLTGLSTILNPLVIPQAHLQLSIVRIKLHLINISETVLNSK
jgi:hypothetical protein